MTDTFTKSERSRIMAAVKSKDTAPELAVRRLVHAMGYRYRLHVRSLPGVPDMVFPRFRKIINVHGCFWHLHGCPRCRVPSARRRYWLSKLRRNAKRDAMVRRKLQREGWQVLTIWECQTTPKKLESLRKRLIAFFS
ncbi:MAG: DNA mismatch endonuclease Vsr [Pirellulales bacterium]|nr:DNA mismatch endonuclease Vsr [Pirellulales bacterium]